MKYNYNVITAELGKIVIMEYFDVVDEAGQPTGKTVSRENAHTYGILHRTAHVWIVRQRDGRPEVLLQKRSMEKDSFPGLYDTSSAGHIPAGDESVPSALRELSEELGISLDFVFHHVVQLVCFFSSIKASNYSSQLCFITCFAIENILIVP